MDIKACTECQVYAMVNENDVVIHRPTSNWNTPDEESPWVIAKTKKPKET